MVNYAPISSRPPANPLTGQEEVLVNQAGTTKRTTSGAISALPFGSAGTAASGISFITVSSASAALPSSRTLAVTSPVTLTDSGAGAPITIGLSFMPGSGTVTSVGLSGGTTGLTISNSPITTNGTMTLGGYLNGTAIATSSITSTQIATNTIGFSKIQQAAGLSVIGVAGAAPGNIGPITLTAGQALIASSGGTTLISSPVVVTVKKQAFTANGTYTPSTGMLYCLAEGVGGGGGGGGVAGTAAAIFIAGGGGSGAYARALLTAAQISASKVVTIGTAGAGGATGPNNASAGGATSLGSLLIAAGGAGGAATSIASVGIGGAGGLASSSTGDIVADGNPGAAGFYNTVNTSVLLLTGMGGCSFFGGGARSAGNAAGASPGMIAGNYGGGGSGGLVNSSLVSTNGGTGSTGVLYITEWCSQ